ncbi:GTP cyclohydrolase I FolE [Flavobacterium psychrophilum]|jgi:GTP cyclohydrolase I|uniref:GTP cyclohydrolase I FolE n=1 Tax=Flavobacterium psychrophilum TaxID=96345 RepID=UPI00076EE9F6|nr:GTP cyclohydrolase I FolE [Flavobacterium psychrophilum]EKT2068954.1 GTP cyclohydrolase I FolE [Flavobacterium psychrophilum]EKT2071054.1 GTP cyclohydrolase I FolE [Flavobacterium psychrophilum]EKT3957984.1 GTP cyclohydrolase I FolE [Flavobacterium psychrophilum]EKT4490573.1 GTP cyclohydrolase I FolE [Flavobacterium psychrophilum]EKT4500074.1 GTP cyclohydrolase I FolE [Flavobacterium psychrophilum]
MSILTDKEITEILGDNHQMTSANSPIRSDAFVKTDDQKMQNIEKHFYDIMQELGLDMTDDSLQGTPHRVAKMFIQEIFSGLDPKNKPAISTFDNEYHYDKMLVEANISFNSTCEHHFLPIFGKAHIGYISSGKVIGLSKLNRIVDYFSRRPQVQERLIMQIFNDLKIALNTENVIVVMEAKHLCVSSRGIKHESSFTSTIQYGGIFNEKENRNDFFNMINSEK